uniref:A20-type domain-containing protein n=1 Tax=Hordeum vulgare subsp. vulgare TaxID=112509 RepID=A0A8I6XC88_HORVV
MEARQQQQQAGGAILCASGCGFFAGAGTNDLCSKCFKEQQLLDVKAFDGAAMSGLPSLTIALYESWRRGGDAREEAMQRVPEEGGTAWIRLPVRGHLLRRAPPRRRAHLLLRLQGRPGQEQIARHNPIVVAPKMARI